MRSLIIAVAKLTCLLEPLTLFDASDSSNGQKDNLVHFDAFDLNVQQYILIKPVLLPVIYPEIGAIEGTARISAADLLLEHWMLDALEGFDSERYRLCDAVKG